MTKIFRDGTVSVFTPFLIRTKVTACTYIIFRAQTTSQSTAGNSKFTLHTILSFYV